MLNFMKCLNDVVIFIVFYDFYLELFFSNCNDYMENNYELKLWKFGVLLINVN